MLAGAAYFPAVDELVAAAPGAGCWWNGSALRVSSVSDARRGDGAHHGRALPRAPGARRRLAGARRAQASVSRTWGDCYGYLLVATGRAEVMCDEALSPWDAAALQPIIEEAGGVFTDWRACPRRSAAAPSRRTRALADEVRAVLGAGRPLRRRADMLDLDALDFAKGRRPRDGRRRRTRDSGAVLMVAHADREALERTLATGEMHYRSRTRGLWHKGATSGNVQRSCRSRRLRRRRGARARAPGRARRATPARASCFGDAALAADALGALDATIAARERPIGADAGGGEAELHAAAARRPQPAPQEDRRGGRRAGDGLRGRGSRARRRGGGRRPLPRARGAARRRRHRSTTCARVLAARVGAPRR